MTNVACRIRCQDDEVGPLAHLPRSGHGIQAEDFRFVRPLIGFETFAKEELIATQGKDEIRAPCDDCTVFMPAQRVIVGREAVYLTRPL